VTQRSHAIAKNSSSHHRLRLFSPLENKPKAMPETLIISLISLSLFSFSFQLVTASPSQRNWRGILIALLVIIIVLALIITSVVSGLFWLSFFLLVRTIISLTLSKCLFSSRAHSFRPPQSLNFYDKGSLGSLFCFCCGSITFSFQYRT
jgi:hypothetical protein